MAKKFALMKKAGFGWQQIIMDGKNKKQYEKMEREMRSGNSRGFEVEKKEDSVRGLVLYRADDMIMIECLSGCVSIYLANASGKVFLNGEFKPFGDYSAFPRDGIIQEGITFFRKTELYEIEIVD